MNTTYWRRHERETSGAYNKHMSLWYCKCKHEYIGPMHACNECERVISIGDTPHPVVVVVTTTNRVDFSKGPTWVRVGFGYQEYL